MKNILLVSFFVIFLSGFTIFNGKYKDVKENRGVISIPTGDITSEKAVFYKYNFKGKDIKFFFLRTKDGTIRAAFDACDVCYPAKKGYSQSSDFMVCNNCGQKFHVSGIGLFRGGCNPSPLNFKVDKGFISVSLNELLSHYNYF